MAESLLKCEWLDSRYTILFPQDRDLGVPGIVHEILCSAAANVMPVVALFHDPPLIEMFLMLFHASNLPQITYQRSRHECPKINLGITGAKLLVKKYWSCPSVRENAAWTWSNSLIRRG